MRAVDTNVLVRLLAKDDRRQSEAAEQYVSGGAWISTLALAEMVWVLESAYGRSHREIAVALDMLLEHKQLVLQDGDVVAAARALFGRKPSLGFSDCLLLEIARKAGHVPLGTFDKALGKMDGASLLEGQRVR